MLYRTGYKKAHYRHLPVVLTHSTLDKCFYLVQCANWHRYFSPVKTNTAWWKYPSLPTILFMCVRVCTNRWA